MKMLICVLTTCALASFAPRTAAAADLSEGYDERDTVIEERAPVIEHERIIERRYYKPSYADDEPVYYERYRPYPYYVYPYRWRPHLAFWPHRHWGPHGRW